MGNARPACRVDAECELVTAMIDWEKIEQLQAEADALIEERELRELQAQDDPIGMHEHIMASLQTGPAARVEKSAMPKMIYKIREDARVRQPQPYAPDESDDDNDFAAPFDDAQLDTMAAVIAEIRQETRDMIAAAIAPLSERIATLEGQIGMLMAMLGGNNNKSYTASEIIRKVRVAPPRKLKAPQ